MIDVVIGALAAVSILCYLTGMRDIASLLAYSGGFFVISVSLMEAING